MIKFFNGTLAGVMFTANIRFMFGLLFCSTFYSSCQSDKPDQDLDTISSKTDSLEFYDARVKLYISARVWGIAGNHEELRIFDNVSSDTIRLYTMEAFYRKTGNDSLLVYAPGSAIPAGIGSVIGEVKVIVTGLTSQAEVADYGRRYLEYGLKRISAINH